MNEAIVKYVGERIRLYRKNSGMSMEEMARKINKSKASISKYEAGKISIDIVTLFDIAEALNISPFQLFDYVLPSQARSNAAKNPFGETNKIYIYHMTRRNVYISVLVLGESNDNGSIRATLFYKVGDPEKLDCCDSIYHGNMFGHDIIFSIVLVNYHNSVENVLLTFTVPLRKAVTITGMISGLGFETLAPTSHKVLLSREQLTLGDELAKMLTIDAAAFSAMKRSNMLYVPLT